MVPDELPGITTLRAPIEDGSDVEFMERWAQTGLWGTPLYFTDSLRRWPHLYALTGGGAFTVLFGAGCLPQEDP
ncbi:hypothetical protein GCM10027405_26480 [Arthrobacter alkaliphilus]